MSRDPFGLPAFRIGDRVREVDGRHVGTVRAVLFSRTARVVFDDSAFIADFDMTDLESCDDE